MHHSSQVPSTLHRCPHGGKSAPKVRHELLNGRASLHSPISLSLLVQEAKTLKKLCVRSSRSNLKSLLRSTIRSTNDDDQSLFLPTSVLVTGLKPQRRLGLARSCASVGNFIHKIKSPPHGPCPSVSLPSPRGLLRAVLVLFWLCLHRSFYLHFPFNGEPRPVWWCWCRLKLSAESVPREVTKIPKSD